MGTGWVPLSQLLICGRFSLLQFPDRRPLIAPSATTQLCKCERGTLHVAWMT